MNDKCVDNEETFEYNINEVPFGGEIGSSIEPDTDVQLEDASPDKYLVLYSVKTENDIETDTDKYKITKFACVPLKTTDDENPKNWLLQYPCTVNVLTEGGKGKYLVDGKQVQYLNTTIEFNSSFNLPIIPDNGYEVDKVDIVNGDTDEIEQTIQGEELEAIDDTEYTGIKIANVTSNIKIKTSFTPQQEE